MQPTAQRTVFVLDVTQRAKAAMCIRDPFLRAHDLNYVSVLHTTVSLWMDVLFLVRND